MKILKILVLIFILSIFKAFAQNYSDPETRGVWVAGSYLKGGADAIEGVMKKLSAANFNVIYVDVWYQGSTIYPSSVVENAGGPRQNPVFVGTDPLKTTIEIAHKYGIDVIAWFEYAFMVGHSYDSTVVPEIIKKHPDWSILLRDTTKNFFHNKYGYFFAIDPSVNAAADFSVNLYKECAENYPEIDGIESDIENDTTISYSDTSRIKFMKETGNPDPLTLASNNQAWITWRRGKITNVIKRIYKGVKQINPKCIVTAAVPPPYMRSYSLEAWWDWTKEGYVDMVEPMLYLSVASFYSQLNVCKNYVPPGFLFTPGIDINSAGSVDNTIQEINQVRNNGGKGQTIWYYGYLLSYTGMLDKLRSSIYTNKTSPTFDDLVIDNSDKYLFSTIGNWSSNSGGYKDSYLKASATAGDTAVYTFRILRSGRYSILGYWSGDSASNSSSVYLTIKSKTINEIDTLDQIKNLNRWNFINKIPMNSGDTVTIKLSGTGGKDLIADAFRLKRGNIFRLMDYAMPDSQNILLKFSNPLLNPVSSDTKVNLSTGKNSSGFYVDKTDQTVLHVSIPSVLKGTSFQLNIDNLVDVSHDTLNTSVNVNYNPDSTEIILDDQTPGAFYKLAGNWIEDTSYSAYNEKYYYAKQTSSYSRIQWGPKNILIDGYYDVFVKIPQTIFPLSKKCLYLVRDHFKTDSIYISQDANSGSFAKLGTFPFKAGDPFAVLLCTVPDADTGRYVAADAVLLKRSVEISAVKNMVIPPDDFTIYQNYPNPFNPSTVINIYIKSAAKVYINIYNSLGQKVDELLGGKDYKPGNWKIKFNGSSLSSGVYFAFIRIKGEKFLAQKTLKMLLLK